MGAGSVCRLMATGALFWGLSGVASADLPGPGRPSAPLPQEPSAAPPCASDMQMSTRTRLSPDPMPGKVVLDCEIAASGSLSDCKVLSEEPPGQGYAYAALKVACGVKMTSGPADAKGPRPRVKLPITFQVKK